ncbi:chromosome partitioning protein, ParB family [Monaibacterium marinum]|uniref:Chromosome partitioning protein, ParB family n=1 Tax=Pontivivens marinum TaxID=1690039 RepID=A0A2C9CP07_9RHOB|nr:ParB/RepB/Spo0J family partition protein [Monaibacterium marinum]SOH93261.1 chromosome partitioning protein, ParB family [Monaibacterium marinum]
MRKPDRKGLGRGLSALLVDVDPAQSSGNQNVQHLPIDNISPNPDQPRRSFTEENLEELTRSIREKGVIQPLIVRVDPKNSERYQIVAGERRWRASQRAKLHELPVVIREFNDVEVLEVAIIENIQRSDLNAVEEARGYKQLMEKFGHTQEKLAEALGKSRSYIANLLRLLVLPDEILDMLVDGKLTAGHARTLVPLADPVPLAHQIVQQGLSVREAEKRAKAPVGLGTRQQPRAPKKDADTRSLEGDLSATLGLAVSIQHQAGGGGQVSVTYNDLDELDRLCQLLSGGV